MIKTAKDIRLDPLVQWLQQQPFVRFFLERKIEIFLVGGSVRQILSGQKTPDIDLVFDARGNDPVRSLSRFGSIRKVGESFSVFKFNPKRSKGDAIDLSFARNTRTIGENPDLCGIHDDLASRDFTINAMAIDLANGSLIDDFNGQTDLQNRLVRTVSNHVFSDDPLRMLRAIRFAGVYNLKIESKTFEMMRDETDAIREIAPERIALELKRMLTESKKSSRALNLLDESGLLPHVIEPLYRTKGIEQPKPYHDCDVYEHTLRAIDAIPPDPILRFAALAHDFGKPDTIQRHPKEDRICFFRHEEHSVEIFREWAQTMKLSSASLDIDTVCLLIRHHMRDPNALVTPKAARRFLSELDDFEKLTLWGELIKADCLATAQPERVDRYAEIIENLKDIWNESEALAIKDLVIDGQDIMDTLSLSPGPLIGEILREALEIVLDDPVRNNRESLLAWLKGRR